MTTIKFIPAKLPDKYAKSRKIVYMTPEEYLNLALPRLDAFDVFDERIYNKESLNNLKSRLKKGLEIDPPYFIVDYESHAIIGHSGRHRAYMAHKLGIKKIPVVLYFKHAGLYIEKFGGIFDIPEKINLKPELIGLSYKRRK